MGLHYSLVGLLLLHPAHKHMCTDLPNQAHPSGSGTYNYSTPAALRGMLATVKVNLACLFRVENEGRDNCTTAAFKRSVLKV